MGSASYLHFFHDSMVTQWPFLLLQMAGHGESTALWKYDGGSDYNSDRFVVLNGGASTTCEGLFGNTIILFVSIHGTL